VGSGACRSADWQATEHGSGTCRSAAWGAANACLRVPGDALCGTLSPREAAHPAPL
jgi:hypothetical protein